MSNGINLNDFETKMQRVMLKDLKIHPIAQRRLVSANLKRMTANFNPSVVGTIHTIEKRKAQNGKIVPGQWVIDGQTRQTAGIQSGHGTLVADVQMFVGVIDDPTACSLFLDLNKRATVHPYDTYELELAAGFLPAVGVRSIMTKEHGLEVSRTSRDGCASCVVSLKVTYGLDSGESLGWAIDTILNSWGDGCSGLEGPIIQGLGLVHCKHGDALDQSSLVKKLAKMMAGASGLLGQARTSREIRGSTLPRNVARVALDIYNKGRRSGTLGEL